MAIFALPDLGVCATSRVLGRYNHGGWQEQAHIQGQEGREEENVSNFFLHFVAASF
jgi:hypothetical protein